MPAVLYSFPFRIGEGGICSTAWHQVEGAARGGARMILLCSSIGRPVDRRIETHTTLSVGSVRIPLRCLGRARGCNLHDRVTACWLERHGRRVDVIHGWPLSSLHTMRVAKRLGIPFVLERPNAHTSQAFESSMVESKIIGSNLPSGHDHEFNELSLSRELKEYDLADFLLCPSDFVVTTFQDRGFDSRRLKRHHYGYDQTKFFPGKQDATQDRGLVMLYVGSCEPRKGLHYALQAWFESGAYKQGRFLVCGTFIPSYAAKLKPMLEHHSIEVLGPRKDIPELMRMSDLLVLSSVEEGSALVTYEARASGCVLMVSDASGAVCRHLENAMIHKSRDHSTLASQLSQLNEDRVLLTWLRRNSLASAGAINWDAAGLRLSKIYTEVATIQNNNHATLDL